MREALINSPIEPVTFTQGLNTSVSNQQITNLLASSDKCFSVEICANRTLDTDLLAELNTSFCSVTWHSPTTEDLNHVGQVPALRLARQLRLQGYNVLLHVAGRDLRKHQAWEIFNVAKDVGVRNVLALQGDPSQIKETDDAKCDFPYAADLVRFIRLNFGNYFCIGVAGYPEKHPKSRSLEEDIHYLKEKVNSGADFIITQASYDFEAFQSFSRVCRSSGITLPIIPGIFIITSYKSLIAISKFCDVPISSYVLRVVSDNKDNSDAVREFGIHHAAMLIKHILRNDFRGFHIFSLNDLKLVKEVVKRLGLLKLYIEYPLGIQSNN